jgi:hypothetical protein
MKRRTFLSIAVPVISLVAFSAPVESHGGGQQLSLSAEKAPIVPDGTTAGADTDFVITFTDRDPDVPGIGIKSGGTVSVKLPKGFVQDDPSAPMTMVVLQGWPQSPRQPFPAVSYDENTNTLTGTLSFDYLPESTSQPGPKQVHLLLPGFTNPKAGTYKYHLAIQPDPGSSKVLQGWGKVRIRRHVRASINAISVINPPPPFPNPIYQTVAAGEALHTWGFYLWERGGDPSIGVDLERRNARRYRIVDADGESIGTVRIRAPKGASGYSIEATASVPVDAAVLGIPTGLLLAEFHPDPDTPGDYEITWRLRRGNHQHMFVTVE